MIPSTPPPKFNLPIFYNKEKCELNDHVVCDLELIEPIDTGPCMYDFVIGKEKDTAFSRDLIPQLGQYYTTNTTFLKQTQKLLKTLVLSTDKSSDKSTDKSSCKDKDPFKQTNAEIIRIIDLWNEIKMDNGFKDKYMFVNWEMWEFLNHSEHFLQLMSMYNMASPIISLITPIIVLIVPFFIIQLRGLRLSFSEYYDIIKIILANHSIGKLLTNFHEVKIEQKVYILLSVAFYFFSIYQNILCCLSFKNNMIKIHTYLFTLQKHMNVVVANMDAFLTYSNDLSTYQPFNYVVREKRQVLVEILYEINKIDALTVSFSKFSQVGHVLKTFYELHNEELYNDAILYSFGFNGYISVLEGIQKGISDGILGFADFSRKPKNDKIDKTDKTGKEKTRIRGNYYAALAHATPPPVRNNVSLHKNIIITGPNASGKTTVLKSVLINIILTQQFGCGFYKDATIVPYSHIHCYLNIPDTSGRDSLFQAESRRCKEILDEVKEKPEKERHVCIFDELFSGTNPDEAVGSATAFMDYLMKYKNVDCLLTTHFIQVCNNLEKNSRVVNYCMDTLKEEEDGSNKTHVNTYKLKQGISLVKGGVQVLRDLNYPKEIIDSMNA